MSDTSGAAPPSSSSPSNPYQTSQGSSPLVVVGQQLTQAVNNLAQVALSSAVFLSISSAILNAFRPPTASSSPITTGINNLGTTAIPVLAANTTRHGLIFHNPATTNVNIYAFQSTIATAPTLSAVGGAFVIVPGATLAFPSVEYQNINTAFSAFAGTGTSNALTIVEFL